MTPKADRLLFIALILGIVLHGSALLYNLDKTYDAFVHIFFADHYARSWFDPWEFRWYTGFPVTSYPPLSHQLIALFSFAGGLKFGFAVVALSALSFFVIGIYRFSQLWVPQRSAAWAALFAVAASSITQTIHIYGQLPTMLGISCLVNALPEVYAWFRSGRYRHLLMALGLLSVTVASHHVTTIFGIVFFIAPTVATAFIDESGVEGKFFVAAKNVLLKAVRHFRRFLLFFPPLLCLIVVIIFPYWYWSKTDPISQVPIPHGSRDSFIAVPSSGLMFFIIPLGFTLLMLPFIFRSLYTRRNIFLALSFSLLLLLGTGGTTPVPKMILGDNAFNILTLDRFTFWASVLAIPFIGDFFRRLTAGDIRDRIIDRYGKGIYHATSLLMIAAVAFQALFIINFHKYRSLQPAQVDVQPILHFLQRDEHDHWRFMTLGFGDQMAWLSAQTSAYSIDGNYHSARRVPEMTNEPLERLENSKFKGIPGIGSLQQFLTIPEKYYLKFIFSNDKFYDPILYFAGWERVQRLENGIMVWQKPDIPPLPAVLPRKGIAASQRYLWGTLPMLSLLSMLCLLVYNRRNYLLAAYQPYSRTAFRPANGNRLLFLWMALLLVISVVTWARQTFMSWQRDPDTLLKAYYHALDFKYFQEAHSYFPPGSIPFDEYMLRLSLRDGLLASYGKLDSIGFTIQYPTAHAAIAQVTTQWVTPLELYTLHSVHHLERRSGKWYIQPPAFDKTIAPDEHLEKGMAVFHSQGKRVVSTTLVRHEDVLDRPSMQIVSARLVKKDNRYAVVGEAVHTGHLPAHVTIEAQLFDGAGRKLVAYNAKYNTLHKVLPAEKIPFRIEFESTAWVTEDDKRPLHFDPQEFTDYRFDGAPTDFRVFVRCVVADKDLYRDHGVQRLQVDSIHHSISGQLFNYGVQEISVPQLLITYYGPDSVVSWVDHVFLRDGIRPQEQQDFRADLAAIDSVRIIRQGTSDRYYVNGILQTGNVAPGYRMPGHLPALPHGSGWINFTINGYIGNPTIY